MYVHIVYVHVSRKYINIYVRTSTYVNIRLFKHACIIYMFEASPSSAVRRPGQGRPRCGPPGTRRPLPPSVAVRDKVSPLLDARSSAARNEASPVVRRPEQGFSDVRFPGHCVPVVQRPG